MEDGGSGGEVEPSNPVDYSALYPGALATVKLDQMAEYGAIMDIVGQEDLVGLIHPHQGAADPELLGGEGCCRGGGEGRAEGTGGGGGGSGGERRGASSKGFDVVWWLIDQANKSSIARQVGARGWLWVPPWTLWRQCGPGGPCETGECTPASGAFCALGRYDASWWWGGGWAGGGA
jgi:hypothetical protein